MFIIFLFNYENNCNFHVRKKIAFDTIFDLFKNTIKNLIITKTKNSNLINKTKKKTKTTIFELKEKNRNK